MAYKIAVTTSDGVHIDQHFGQAADFYIYEVEEETVKLKGVRHYQTLEGCTLGQDESRPGGCCGGSDSRVSQVSELLQDCEYLLTERIGAKPHRLLQQKGIDCLEAPEDLLEALQKLMIYRKKHTK